MNEDGTPIEAGAAGAPEGAAGVEPTIDEVSSMYKELGIKAPAPTGAAKGRPKSSTVRAKDVSDDDDADSKSGREDKKPSGSKSKDAPANGTDGDAGDDTDAQGTKVGKDAGKVSGKSEGADDGVRSDKSRAEKDSERGSEEDSEQGTDGTRQAAHDEGGEEEEGQDDEKGKRPGKSNPEIEKRFQKLAQEKRERDEIIADLQKKLQEKAQLVEQTKIAQEDPEYTIEDFSKVRDSEGNIIDLDPERAELAWRRWQDGYNQRTAEREAKAIQEAEAEERESEMTRQVMEKSVKAYDALAALMDEYPELVSTSGKFDADFAAEAMPIIQQSIEYLEGTEPGNTDGNVPVVIGLKIHPKLILDAMKKIDAKKRTLPLNGINDNVETRSNVGVPHSRSSDPAVNAANELYKTLNINKRF